MVYQIVIQWHQYDPLYNVFRPSCNLLSVNMLYLEFMVLLERNRLFFVKTFVMNFIKLIHGFFLMYKKFNLYWLICENMLLIKKI